MEPAGASRTTIVTGERPSIEETMIAVTEVTLQKITEPITKELTSLPFVDNDDTALQNNETVLDEAQTDITSFYNDDEAEAVLKTSEEVIESSKAAADESTAAVNPSADETDIAANMEAIVNSNPTIPAVVHTEADLNIFDSAAKSSKDATANEHIDFPVVSLPAVVEAAEPAPDETEAVSEAAEPAVVETEAASEAAEPNVIETEDLPVPAVATAGNNAFDFPVVSLPAVVETESPSEAAETEAALEPLMAAAENDAVDFSEDAPAILADTGLEAVEPATDNANASFLTPETVSLPSAAATANDTSHASETEAGLDIVQAVSDSAAPAAPEISEATTDQTNLLADDPRDEYAPNIDWDLSSGTGNNWKRPPTMTDGLLNNSSSSPPSREMTEVMRSQKETSSSSSTTVDDYDLPFDLGALGKTHKTAL